MSRVPFEPDAVRAYLDHAIRTWRSSRNDAVNDPERSKAELYVDAYQSVRMALFGELLP